MSNPLSKHIFWLIIVLCLVMVVPLFLALFTVCYDGNMRYFDALKWVTGVYVSPTLEGCNFSASPIFNYVIPYIIWLIQFVAVAILIGIVSSYLYDFLETRRRDRNLKELSKRIKDLFRPTTDLHTKFKVVPRYVSLTTAQIRLKYDAKDIIEAVRKTNDIRLANLATTYSIQEKTFDRMILEKFPRNNDYGFFVDNGSNVTIVSTSSCRQIGTGNFAYHIAAMGGFNYISREIDENPADYKSFYAIDDDLWDNRDNDSSFGMFISDLGTLINKESGSSKWVIFIMSTKRICESNVHFIVNAENGALTINEEEKFNEFFNGVKSKLEHHYCPVKVD